MIVRPYVGASLCLAFTGLTPLLGGELLAPDTSKTTVPTSSPEEALSPNWQLTANAYGWLAGINGTLGAGGYSANADVPFSKILENLDMTAAMQLELRYDRWMLLADGMYLRASADSETPGRLFSSVGLEVEQVLAEVDLGYRVWEGEAGFLDVFAGARYLKMDNTLSLDLDGAGVQSLSQDISARASSQVSTAVSSKISEVAPDLRESAREKIGSAVRSNIVDRVGEFIGNNPRLPEIIRAIRNSDGPVGEAVQELIAAKVAEKQATLDDAAAAASEQVAAAKSRARQKLRRAVTQAEKKLAQRIEHTIKENVPDQVSASKSWVDPIIGVRARYNFTDKIYALARADIGGFGVSSDLTWQAYGAVGYQCTSQTAVELGYRHLYVDYRDGDFIYDVDTSGAMVSLIYHF